MRKLFIVLLVLIALPNVFMLVLYGWNPVVAARFVSLFATPDGDYSNLSPRSVIKADGSYVLSLAGSKDKTISADALEAMQEFAIKHNSYSLIVVHKGVIQTEWYAEGWNRSRKTQSQSMHKSILPILIQAAIEDGAIGSVKEPIRLYIPEWQDDPRGEITIEKMLEMSSGLHSPPFSLNPFSDDYLWLFDTDVTPVLLRMPKEWEQGEKWDYNNVNSELLGLVVERATGKGYADYLSAKVWLPMGADGAEVWLDSAGGKAHSSCCLLAPTLDWVKFGMLLLGQGEVNGNRVVAADFISRMITPAPVSDWYGYQIWLNDKDGQNPWLDLTKGYQRTEPFLTTDAFYTSGFGAQRIYVVPSEDLVIVRMGPATPAPVRSDWDNSFLVNTALRNIQ